MRFLILLWLGAAAAPPPLGAADMSPPARRSPDLAPPRDPDIAVREELEAARRAGTVAAYDLFIARQSGHPLAEVARQERERLLRKR